MHTLRRKALHDHRTESDHEHDSHSHSHKHETHNHDHDEQDKHGHGHEHGKVDTDLYGNRAGLRAVQVSTAGMLLVSAIQFAIAWMGGSAGLFADALHNFGDVFTTIALWIAFVISNRAANQRYTYGYYRSEDLAGIVITIVILTVVYSTSRSVLQRLLDAVDPRIVPSIITNALAITGVEAVTDVRARWVGHTLHVVMNIEVDAELTLSKAHAIAEEVRHRLFHNIKGISEVVIHTDPSSASGDHHQGMAHHIQAAQRPVLER